LRRRDHRSFSFGGELQQTKRKSWVSRRDENKRRGEERTLFSLISQGNQVLKANKEWISK
jgi:hypothetical protein